MKKTNSHSDFGRNERRSKILWSLQSILGYIWDIIVNIIIIVGVLLIYSNAHNTFEIIVYSLLILVFLSIIFYGAGNAQISMQTRIFLARELVGKDDIKLDTEIEEATFLLDKMMYKYYINTVFRFLIFIIVLYNLIPVLL